MLIYGNNARSCRGLLKTLTVTAAALLLGIGAGIPRASAQAEKEKGDKAGPRAPIGFGDEPIDPNQPLKPDFLVSISVVGEPDPSGNYAIDQSGNVSVRYGGIMTPVSVKGLTPAQAADAIAKFLKTYIKNPQVTVSIISIPRPVVFATGAIKTPGPVTIPADTTLVDVLSRVEWSENADLSKVRISRKEIVDGKEKSSVITVQFDRYIKVAEGQEPDETQNPVLKDKDRIFVPFKSLPGNGVVSIGGEVTKPVQSIPLRTNPPMTVREIINLVGGTTVQANRKAVSIRRPSVDRPLVIDLDKAEQGDLVNNIELKPDDVIYVEKLENNAYININGGFVKPGKFVYDKRTTLTQVVMEAGGVQPNAKLKEGKIFRHPDNDPKNMRVIAFNWLDIEKGKAPDIELQAGDSVWVTPNLSLPKPSLGFSQILSDATRTLYLFRMLSGRGGNNFGIPFF